MRSLALLSTIFLGLCSIVYSIGGESCPSPEAIMPCRCRGKNEQIQVWCSHSDLERVNGALSSLMRLKNAPAIDELIVENNKMPSLPARAFGALRIGRLLLRNNGLESVSRNAFAGLENSLEELYIVEPSLSDFPFDSIEQLKSLEALTVENSKIRLLPKFNGLNNLKHIRIDGSRISDLPLGAFSSIPSIKQIHLVHSHLARLPQGIFGPLPTLQLANFSGNSIKNLERRTFALLPKLEVLSLSENKLEDAVTVGRACEELSSLKSLDLSQNSFKILPEASFVNLKTLQMLNLAHNFIREVNPHSFTHLPALRKVDLSFNELRNFPKMFFDSSPLLEELRMRRNLLSSTNEISELLGSLKSLRFLDLGENGLTELNSGSFSNHAQLEKVDLSDNKLQKIHRGAFVNLPSLTDLTFRNNSLLELPSGTEVLKISSLTHFDLSSNNLQNLGAEVFKELPSLVKIDLSFNNIKSLPPFLFSSNTQLQSLEIIGNGMSSIANSAFNKLSNLLKLDLSRNHIEQLESGSFRDLTKLKLLNLASNRINNLPPDLITNLENLEEISFKTNSINNLPTNFFSSQKNLREISLKFNSLSEVHGRMFGNLRNLRTLKLATNKISRIDQGAFDELDNLKYLDLSSNRLTLLPGAVFSKLKNLEKFEGRENRISSVENLAFSNCEKIQIFDLSQNALESVPVFIMESKSLRVLDLSQNQIKKIEENTFGNAKNLSELYLNENKISTLSQNTLSNLPSLTIVDLDGNEIEELKSETFVNLPRLIYLRLSGNKIRVVRNLALVGLSSLDGLDLQENEIGSIGELSFERTTSLKYLNLSHNNFDDMRKMGLASLSSLEVLDMSFNKLRIFDEKALRHLQWLVELRVNDNGICSVPQGIFDGMSRLKMLILRNNSISHLYEPVFQKLKNNIAFLDISGNPISCDCELIWLQNLIAREGVKELTDFKCENPNEIKGALLKSLRPGRMICSNSNRIERRNGNYEESSCPILLESKRRPRPVYTDPTGNERPIFGSSPDGNYPNFVDGHKNQNRKKDEKLVESNDYTPGDSPTIYASSSSNNNKVDKFKGQENGKLSNIGLNALSTLFGIPIPSLDFGLNLGISPSVSIANKKDDKFNYPPEPLPNSWLSRPSKIDLDEIPGENIYEPPEYIPRRPAQPYIPLNPYAESNKIDSFKNLRNSNKGGQYGAESPIKFPDGDLSPNKFGYTTNQPPSSGSWHPSYPTAETGFIPIQPFFHGSIGQRSKGNGIKKGEEQKLTTAHPSLDEKSKNDFLLTPTERPVTLSILENEAEVSTPTQEISEPDEKDGSLNLSDFWGMFSSNDKEKEESNLSLNPPLNFSAPIDTEIESVTKNIDKNLIFNPDSSKHENEDIIKHESDNLNDKNHNSEDFHTRDKEIEKIRESHYSSSESPIGRKSSIGKSTITKVRLEDTLDGSHKNPGKKLSSLPNLDELVTAEESVHLNPNLAHPKIPPVLIGDLDEPLDWYYKNYHVEQNPEEEIEKYLERSRVNAPRDVLLKIDHKSSSSSSKSLFYNHSYFYYQHTSLLFLSIILVYYNSF